jgi:hypothetical protein
LKEQRDNSTIVIVGFWNIGIFTPDWLANNVFDSKEVILEVGLNPGLPRRFTADGITIIPSEDRLILSPKELGNTSLSKMESIACKLLSTLPHTPVRSAGVNFGFEDNSSLNPLASKIPIIFEKEFGLQDLSILSRRINQQISDKGQIINVACEIIENRVLVQFNFHKPLNNTKEGIEFLIGKVSPFHDKSLSILSTIFQVTAEDK